MTTSELIQELMKHSDEYAVESYEYIPTGKYEPIRRHKKKRVAKKWLKKYGTKPVLKKRKCKRIDVSLSMLINFCRDYNLPLPSDLTVMVE